MLEEGPARSEIERWLTETLVRNLYSVSDINERLETLLPASWLIARSAWRFRRHAGLAGPAPVLAVQRNGKSKHSLRAGPEGTGGGRC